MRVLNVEDSARDSALIERELRKRPQPTEFLRVETPEDFEAALDAGTWDLIIADHKLPRFSSLAALALLRATGRDIPLIVVSGTMGLDFAVEAMRAGARDYLVKSDLVRLNSVVERELHGAAGRRLQADRHALAGQVLELLGGSGDLLLSLHSVLGRLLRHAGADAAGIRLRVQDDFPYFAQVGFDQAFLAAEGSLCVLDDGVAPLAGMGSGPALACLCGAVLRRHEALGRLVTPRGSYVTGRLAEAAAPGGELQGVPNLRGRCAIDHFPSVALVPLRSGDDVVGLLQLNARSADRFDAGLVAFLEEIAPSLGLAVDRRRSQEALRLSEERYRVLVETSPNGVALIRLDSTILMANRRLASLLGVADAAALEGRPLLGFVAAEDRTRAEVEMKGFIARGAPRVGHVRFHHGEASFDGEISAGMTSNDAAQAALVVVLRDVSEQRRLQARLAQSDRMASVGMLAAGVAHEINNPLTYVLCNLESLAADLPAAEASLPVMEEPLELEKRAREALEGARRIREIVRDLKVFSRSGSDRLEPVSLNKAIQGAVNMTHNEVKYRARLVASYGDVPAVLANEGRLAQVFLNLLVNAAQAIREGDVDRNSISVRTWREADSVLAEVRDSGCGMSPEVQRQVFEPFFTTKPAGIGTGLGLAISRGIVEEAGGRITVESATGEGTRFLVRLPAASEQAMPAAQAKVVAAVVRGARRGRVLVVDDEVYVRAVVKRLLRGEHEVVEAGSGNEAEALLAADDRFDVILTDLLMPEVSGMDLYDGLAATRPDLAARVVFMSGGVFTQRASTFLEGLPNTRIEKPIDSDALRQVVRVMVAARGAG
jgi:PAS domain S-box-containing protein